MHPKYVKEITDEYYTFYFDVAGLIYNDSLSITIDDDKENNNRIL